MSITSAGQVARQGTRSRTAVCLLVPMTLLFAHFMHGSDALVQTAWAGLAVCLSLGGILLMRPASDIPPAALGMFLILGLFVTAGFVGNWHQARTEVTQLAIAILVWTSGAMLARSRTLLLNTWTALSASLAIYAAIALFSYPISAAGAENHDHIEHAYRLSFTFNSPNIFASLMGLGVIISVTHIAYLMRTRVASGIPLLARLNYLPREGMVSIVALFLCGSCLVLSLSRAAILLTLGFFAFTAVAEVFVRRTSETVLLKKYRYRIIGALVVSFGLVLLAVLTFGDFGARAGNLGADGAGRWSLLSEYWAAWQKHPVFGHGLGSFNRINESITTMDNAALLVLLGAAHNVVLQWLLQVGLAGLAAMALVQLYLHRQIIIGACQGTYRTRSYVARMTLAASVFLFLHNMIDFPLEVPSVMWTYAFLLGLACGMAGEVGSSRARKR